MLVREELTEHEHRLMLPSTVDVKAGDRVLTIMDGDVQLNEHPLTVLGILNVGKNYLVARCQEIH